MRILAAMQTAALAIAKVLVQGGVLNLTRTITARRSTTVEKPRFRSGAVRLEPHEGRVHVWLTLGHSERRRR